jgi:hypothetical protein
LPAVNVPFLAVEHRLEAGQFFQLVSGRTMLSRVTPACLQTRSSKKPDSQACGRFLMTFERQLVLFLAADVPFTGHALAVLAHRQPGARLGVARRLWRQLTGSKSP